MIKSDAEDLPSEVARDLRKAKAAFAAFAVAEVGSLRGP